MENKEEMIEEIEDIKEDEATKDANTKIDSMLDQAMDNTTILSPQTNTTEAATTTPETVVDPVVLGDADYVEPKKGKTALIIILVVLLLLDIIALVVYLIGLDKLGFIQ